MQERYKGRYHIELLKGLTSAQTVEAPVMSVVTASLVLQNAKRDRCSLAEMDTLKYYEYSNTVGFRVVRTALIEVIPALVGIQAKQYHILLLIRQHRDSLRRDFRNQPQTFRRANLINHKTTKLRHHTVLPKPLLILQNIHRLVHSHLHTANIPLSKNNQLYFPVDYSLLHRHNSNHCNALR